MAHARSVGSPVSQTSPQTNELSPLLAALKKKFATFDDLETNERLAANLEQIASHPALTAGQRKYFLQYQSTVESWRRSDYVRYPQQVHIETSATCNASCNFCPYVELDRINTRMSDELFEKIVNDLKQIPSNVTFNVCPFKVSDPLLEKRLPDMISHIHDQLPNAYVWLATNGSALTEKNIERLAKGARRKIGISISLNDHRKDVYQQIMGLSFDRTVSNLRVLHNKFAAGGFPHDVFVGRVSGQRQDDLDFVRWVRNEFPAFPTMVKAAGNWIGETASRTSNLILPVGCIAWFQVSIMATGDVALCCMDGKGEVRLGSVAHTDVLDIYNSPEHRAFRERSLSRHDRSPCSKCTYPETRGETILPNAAIPEY